MIKNYLSTTVAWERLRGLGRVGGHRGTSSIEQRTQWPHRKGRSMETEEDDLVKTVRSWWVSRTEKCIQVGKIRCNLLVGNRCRIKCIIQYSCQFVSALTLNVQATGIYCVRHTTGETEKNWFARVPHLSKDGCGLRKISLSLSLSLSLSISFVCYQ